MNRVNVIMAVYNKLGANIVLSGKIKVLTKISNEERVSGIFTNIQ